MLLCWSCLLFCCLGGAVYIIASMEGRAEGSGMESVRIIPYAGTLPSGNKAKTNVLVPGWGSREGLKQGRGAGSRQRKDRRLYSSVTRTC